MVRRGLFLCITLAIVPAAAFADAPAAPDPAGADVLGNELPLMGPRLRLTWPLEPKQVSFNLGQPILSADGILQPYHLEALWLQRGPLELRSFQRVEQSVELDCTLTCQPVLERSVGVEARLKLGAPSRAVPETHLFARGESFVSALRSGQRLTLGLGGLLDL
jgi:hypothetical protein